MCIGKVGGRMNKDKEGWDYLRIFEVFGITETGPMNASGGE
jgi:hypothetical protein